MLRNKMARKIKTNYININFDDKVPYMCRRFIIDTFNFIFFNEEKDFLKYNIITFNEFDRFTITANLDVKQSMIDLEKLLQYKEMLSSEIINLECIVINEGKELYSVKKFNIVEVEYDF